jgi:hypothetical protein
VARAAGKAAPAVVVLGALAAVPQVRDFVIPTTSTLTAGHHPAAEVPAPGEVAGAAVDENSASASARAYLPRHATSSSAGPARSTRKSGSSAHRTTHHSGTSASSGSSSGEPGSSGESGSSGSSGGSSATGTGSASTGGASTGGASTGGHAVPKCTGTSGMLPANYAAIVDFLVAHGYTGFAAAGIAGNIYQESKGDPESVGSGGGGLIGWTPLPSGFVTGNSAADLQTQLNALLTYNQGWAQFIPALNAATSATEAADIYMNDFERPGLPVAANREAAAQAVAAACGI